MSKMTIGNLSAVLHAPPALKSVFASSGEEVAQSLPPRRAKTAYLTDRFKKSPANWKRSSATESSYFVGIEEGDGLWLDFNDCANSLDYHLAVVISIQGVNAITGMPCTDPMLEQYVNNCPKCSKPFGHERMCDSCGYKWPKQNYIASTAQPSGLMWLDGFRAADGVVRQYIMTAEKARGVASNVIGEKRVYAIGMSFFLSKDKRERPQPSYLRSVPCHKISWDESPGKWDMISTQNSINSQPMYGFKVEEKMGGFFANTGDIKSCNINTNVSNVDQSDNLVVTTGLSQPCGEISISNYVQTSAVGSCSEMELLDGERGLVLESPSRMKPNRGGSSIPKKKEIKVKNLEVGAGAKINQRIYDDPKDIEFWQEKPAGILYVNYVTSDQLSDILHGGTVDTDGKKEAFMANIPVGNGSGSI